MVLPFFRLLTICKVLIFSTNKYKTESNMKLSWINLHTELDRTTGQCFLNWYTSASSHRFIAVGLPHGSVLPRSKLFSWDEQDHRPEWKSFPRTWEKGNCQTLWRHLRHENSHKISTEDGHQNSFFPTSINKENCFLLLHHCFACLLLGFPSPVKEQKAPYIEPFL
jgi:hypothetical protein